MIPTTMTAARMSNTMTTPATTPPVLLAPVSPPVVAVAVGRLLVHGHVKGTINLLGGEVVMTPITETQHIIILIIQ